MNGKRLRDHPVQRKKMRETFSSDQLGFSAIIIASLTDSIRQQQRALPVPSGMKKLRETGDKIANDVFSCQIRALSGCLNFMTNFLGREPGAL